MKKAIVILCLLVLLPMAVSAQSKTVFKNVTGYYHLLDQKANPLPTGSETYKLCSFSYNYVPNSSPKHISLSFKLSNGNGKGRSVNLDSKLCKITKQNDNSFYYGIFLYERDGSPKGYYIFKSEPYLKTTEVYYVENKGPKPIYKERYTFFEKFETVSTVLDWIYTNSLMPQIH